MDQNDGYRAALLRELDTNGLSAEQITILCKHLAEIYRLRRVTGLSDEDAAVVNCIYRAQAKDEPSSLASLSHEMDQARSTIRRRIERLEREGFIQTEKQGREVICTLTPDAVTRLKPLVIQEVRSVLRTAEALISDQNCHLGPVANCNTRLTRSGTRT